MSWLRGKLQAKERSQPCVTSQRAGLQNWLIQAHFVMDLSYFQEVRWAIYSSDYICLSTVSSFSALPETRSLSLFFSVWDKTQSPKNGFRQTRTTRQAEEPEVGSAVSLLSWASAGSSLPCMPRTSTNEKHVVSVSSSRCCEENGQVPAVPLHLLPNTQPNTDFT